MEKFTLYLSSTDIMNRYYSARRYQKRKSSVTKLIRVSPQSRVSLCKVIWEPIRAFRVITYLLRDENEAAISIKTLDEFFEESRVALKCQSESELSANSAFPLKPLLNLFSHFKNSSQTLRTAKYKKKTWLEILLERPISLCGLSRERR